MAEALARSLEGLVDHETLGRVHGTHIDLYLCSIVLFYFLLLMFVKTQENVGNECSARAV
jgi:hypothetical protein